MQGRSLRIIKIGIDATALPPQPGGAGIYIIQLIRALASCEADFNLTIFAHQIGYYMIDKPDTRNVKWVLVPNKNPVHRLVWEQTMLPRLVRKSGVDLLHSPHYTRPISLACKSVVTFHDMTFFLFPELHTISKRVFFRFAIRMSSRLADGIIAVSENTKRDAMRLLGLPSEKITAVPLGIGEVFRPISNDQVLEQYRKKYQLPERFILTVGVIEPRKNLEVLINSLKNLLDKGLEISLVVAGRLGWMYDGVFHLVKSLGIIDRVHFTGYIPNDELVIIYNLADIFVYPSTYEGFGMPPLEALACGVPVVTSAVSSMPENIGGAGILVPPGDQEALTSALLKLFEDPALREKFSRLGPARAAEFSWKRTAQGTLEVYRKVLAAA